VGTEPQEPEKTDVSEKSQSATAESSRLQVCVMQKALRGITCLIRIWPL